MKTVDLFMFMGQSNMAGRGVTSEQFPESAPNVSEGAGYEFRAITDPTRLYPIIEPFGVAENNPDGADDGNRKTGSMVSAFVNAYYDKTGIPVVAVSASKGGSSIKEWQPGTPKLTDAIARLQKAITYLEQNNYQIRHKYMAWCQGETDGDHHMSGERYIQLFDNMFRAMTSNGIENCFLIQIGHYNGTEDISYAEIRKAQETITEKNPNVVIVSKKFADMKARGLMKDAFHYYQKAYNEVGEEAGRNAALSLIK